MSLLHHPGVPWQAHGARPLTAEEIDANPDAFRIWATIKAIREEALVETEDAYDRGYAEGKAEYQYDD